MKERRIEQIGENERKERSRKEEGKRINSTFFLVPMRLIAEGKGRGEEKRRREEKKRKDKC
jgi:hypothetical protein